MSIRTEPGSGGDPCCPHCVRPFYIEDWGTEYNDPVLGESDITCCHCGKPFEIDVSITITAHKKKGIT